MVTHQDIRTLVEQVWGLKSALSQHADLFHLTLARWDKSEPWAPWNCILLTEDEAIVHYTLAKPELAYAGPLLSRMRQRFAQSRLIFSRFAAEENVFVVHSILKA